MYKPYEKEKLKKLQNKELEILKDFIKIAEENDIKYFAIGGTAIGAMRHKGFIPWDDDIDLAISRDDYYKLEKIIINDYSDKYTLLSPRTNSNYPILEGHLQLNGTKFVDKSVQNIKCEMGIFIDFFIYDNIADDPKDRKKQIRDSRFWGKLLILRLLPFPVLPVRGFGAKILHLATAFVHLLLCVFCFSKEKLYKKATDACTRFNNIKTKNVALFRDLYIEQSMMEYDGIFPLQKVPFEDIQICVPNNNHQILTDYYGDYMKIPDKDKQKNHEPIVLDFGE
ncbi:MAG: LicD family protein [Clostridia bacterium]|nr:LicD family protein [Clostridia bacterium]